MSLDKVLDGLNSAQREVVDLRQHCVAVAVPGAGKTATIAAKAAVLLADPGITVGAVTFSKDAAIELRERILALAGKAAKPRLLAGTFHSLAYRQLATPTGKRPDIASEGHRAAMVSQVLHDLGLEMKLEEAIAIIDRLKMSLHEPADGGTESRLYHVYQKVLGRTKRLDFQDLMRLSVQGMEGGTIAPYRLDYLLVDEFQDCDELQCLWTAIHTRNGAVTCIVGDDDQCIFAWRSALGYRGMSAFASEFGARQVILGKNYRSTSEILSLADRVIRNNNDRIDKELVSHRGPGGSVEFLRYDDEYKEAVAAVEFLAPLLRGGHTAAILARTNRILDPVEAICRSHGVKYYRAAGKSILDQPEAALFAGLLRMLERPADASLESLLAFAGLDESERQLLHDSLHMDKTRLEVKKKDLIALGLSERSADKYRDFLKRLSEWGSLTARGFHSLVLDGVREWMLGLATVDRAKRAINTTYDVVSNLRGAFEERLSFLERRNNEPAADAIVLTTMHASKGLQWYATVLIRCEETIIPDDGSVESEERRLFYVGMTRAQNFLRMSTAKKNPTSRFVVEAGLA
ncbi:putative DNA helicase superfamily I [Cupriavidus taiwanensis]|uniref:DNA 3'-5' helicase n=1 Tax=Cupriavidus taiwanensis TaxID=164546 RepID=A0A375FIQ8_9BURK|nr:ATP-dependent helicase [Cupriavidus taiwanensis]SOZ72731.1 putative DNA helicase superfamily I [Cupriavidus taiwanensis]SOZ73428.1 putative DNA helicase superfamily I [Cupriavidus taiwanensis]SOZ75109.1 putative DNA helicase superfamily I [Cupriavidus taiwanensis]SPA03827.1 putative DNA helicase superfamily I [Cupriavidus taiwanensis]SPA11688.1 putative DNA helicase superfamily I [Cupriavidus taiwanensis]